MNILFNKLIPDLIKQDALTHSHAKNIISCNIIALIATPLYALLYYLLGFPLAAYAIMSTGLIMLCSLLVLRYASNLFIARELIVTPLFLCLVWLSYSLGGIRSSPAFWLSLPPLIAIFLGGLKDGFFWGFLCVVAVCIMYALEYNQIPFPLSPITQELTLRVCSLCGLTIVILYLVYFFEWGKREAAQEIESGNKQLRISKEEAVNLAKKAEIANRLKTEFLANMSHELRTPLNGIIGFTDLIHSGKAGPISKEHYEYLTDVLSSAHHLLQLINDILDLSKIESGKMAFHPEAVNIAALTHEVTDIIRTLLTQKQLELSIEINPTLTNVIIDPRKLKQILYNYLSNAIKFTPNSGKIKIRIFPFGKGQFKIEIIDNGIGIRKADIKKLFIEFQQLDTGFAKKYQGTGLGLALTRRIVEAQNGYVGVTSEINKGSTFFAVLPRNPFDSLI